MHLHFREQRKVPRAIKYQKLWDQRGRFVLVHLTKKLMAQTISCGDAKRVCAKCGTDNPAKRLCWGRAEAHHWQYRALDSFFNNHERTAAALNAQDSRANAGMASREAVKAAQGRVKAWPTTGDLKNLLPTVGHGAFCEWPRPRLVGG